MSFGLVWILYEFKDNRIAFISACYITNLAIRNVSYFHNLRVTFRAREIDN